MNIKEYLKSRNIRPTLQKIKIYEYLQTHRIHPDAETIYKELTKQLPTISRATVYNVLKEFLEKHIVRALPIEQKLRYDSYSDHSHFLCEKCKKVYDIHIPNGNDLYEFDGHIIESKCELYKGICRKCKEKIISKKEDTKMKNKIVATVITTLVVMWLSFVYAQVPGRINFQGRLLDQNKNPRSGLFNMTFSIWDAPTGGSQIWSETQTNVQITNGMFSVQLGAVNPLTADVFSSDNRWLQIQVGDEVLQPRERLVSVAYSLRASVAQSVVAGSITNNEISDTANIAWSKISKAGSSLADLATRSASDLNTGILPSGRLSGNYFNDVKVSSAIYADFAGKVSLGANSVGSYHIIDSTITSLDIKDGEITNADISATANISWTKISKAGSSLADLEIRSASDINSGVLSASRGGTGISGAGGVANRVLITTDGNNWTAGQVSPTTMIAAGTLPSNVVASSIAVNTVYTDSIQNNAVTSLKIADGTITDADISSTANISDTKLATITTANKVSWTAVNKTGSSLGDLATRSASDLTTGNLDIARMPTGGNWNITSNLSIAGSTFVITTLGNIGIGTVSPTAKLDIDGTIRIRGGSPGAGKVLTSDAEGNATWQTPAGGGLPSGTAGQTLRHDGTSWVATSSLFNNGTNIGIGTTSPQYRLSVVNDEDTTAAQTVIVASREGPSSGNNANTFLQVDNFRGGYTGQDAGSHFRLTFARGTRTSPQAVAGGDRIGSILFSAYDGSAYQTPVAIVARTTGTVSSGSVPSRLTFEVGSAFPRNEAMTILPNGNVGVGTVSPTHRLRVEGGILATSSITAQGGFFGDGSQITNIQWGNVSKAGSSLADLATKTLPQLDDVVDFTAQIGDILVRTASGWDRLAAGSDGLYLRSYGPGNVPGWASIPVGIIDPVTTIFLYEEFIGGLGSTGNIGSLGWASNSIGAAPTLSAVAGEVNRWGILRTATSATAGQGGTISLANITATTLSVRPQPTTIIKFACRLNTTTQVTVRIGLADNPTAAQPNNGIYFEYNAGATASNWIGVCRSGGIQSNTGNLLAGDTGWHRFQIRYEGSTVYFSVNGGAETAITTNIPANTTGLQPSFRIVTNEAVSKSIDMDYFSISLTGITR